MYKYIRAVGDITVMNLLIDLSCAVKRALTSTRKQSSSFYFVNLKRTIPTFYGVRKPALYSIWSSGTGGFFRRNFS